MDGTIYASGSGTLVRALLADGLVDKLHLFVFPRQATPSPADAALVDSRGTRTGSKRTWRW